MNARRARLTAVPALAVLAAVVLAACGGGGGSSTSSSTAAAGTGTTSPPAGATGAAATARRTALVACLKKQGVSLPAGFGGGRRFGGTGASGAFPRFGGTGASGAGRRFFGATGASGAGRRFFGATGASGAGGGFPGGGGGGFFASNPKFAAAIAKCGGAFGGFGGGGRFAGGTGASGPDTSNPAYRARVISYAACMKKDGIDLPTPNFSGSGFVFGTKVNRTTSAFIAANAKCQGLLSAPAAGTPAGG
jgi:hypothetical protein